MRIEDLRPGASVVSADGHKLGHLSRFVVDRETLKLTHLVVDTGILRSGEPLWKGGWGLSHDRVVPLGVLDDATSGEVRLTMSAEEFRDLSVDYIEEAFEPIPDVEPGWPDTSDLYRIATSIPGEPGPYMMFERAARPPGTVEIQKDSPVWRLKPHQKIGEVERLLFDEETGTVQALVVRRGFLLTHDVVLPMRYVTEVVADIVRVEISDDELRALERYEPQD